MLTSIATVSISGTLDRKLAAIAEAGYQGVEIFENDLLGFDGTATDVGRMITDFGLICTCYQPFRDFEGLTGSLRQRAFDRAWAGPPSSSPPGCIGTAGRCSRDC